MFSVPLTSPPFSEPPDGAVQLNVHWEHGNSCGSCARCCQQSGDVICPVLDEQTRQCVGYNAFYWRYFNCGRYPSRQREIDYYGCPKWQMTKPVDATGKAFSVRRFRRSSLRIR